VPLVLIGFLYLVGRLQGADPPLVRLAANLANSAWQGIVIYVTFSFPAGRLRTPVDRVLVIGGFVFAALNNLFVLATSPARTALGLNPAKPCFLVLPPVAVDSARPILLIIGYVLIF